MRAVLFIFVTSIALFASDAFAAEGFLGRIFPSKGHARILATAACTTGSYKADKVYMPYSIFPQQDWDSYVESMDGTVIEKGKRGVLVFLADGAKSTLCEGAGNEPAWVIISYHVLD